MSTETTAEPNGADEPRVPRPGNEPIPPGFQRTLDIKREGIIASAQAVALALSMVSLISGPDWWMLALAAVPMLGAVEYHITRYRMRRGWIRPNHVVAEEAMREFRHDR